MPAQPACGIKTDRIVPLPEHMEPEQRLRQLKQRVLVSPLHAMILTALVLPMWLVNETALTVC